jgi:hypothetical protein
MTSLSRAIAWFADQDWPRNGLELDNFLGSGPYKPRQGSHLCHKHLCLIHVSFETAEDNKDRKECHLRAQFLRQEGLPVPKHCSKHDPPCLMQHAALTILEAFLVQFFVLRTAKGKAHLAPPQRPRWHRYSTLEYQLPLTFCQDDSAVSLSPSEMVKEVVHTEGKPELRCRFCSRIKAFKSIIALWSHYVHQHYKSTEDNAWSQEIELVEDHYLLEEVRRTAELWRSYWQHTDGGKHRDPTMIKLKQVAEDNFTWKRVLDW